jgi:hypothetical protein
MSGAIDTNVGGGGGGGATGPPAKPRLSEEVCSRPSALAKWGRSCNNSQPAAPCPAPEWSDWKRGKKKKKLDETPLRRVSAIHVSAAPARPSIFFASVRILAHYLSPPAARPGGLASARSSPGIPGPSADEGSSKLGHVPSAKKLGRGRGSEV